MLVSCHSEDNLMEFLLFCRDRYLGLAALASAAGCAYAASLLDASIVMIDAECDDQSFEAEALGFLCSKLLAFSLQICHDAGLTGTSMERTLSAVRCIARTGFDGGIPQALSPFLPALALLCAKSTGRSRHMLLGTICEAVKV